MKSVCRKLHSQQMQILQTPQWDHHAHDKPSNGLAMRLRPRFRLAMSGDALRKAGSLGELGSIACSLAWLMSSLMG